MNKAPESIRFEAEEDSPDQYGPRKLSATFLQGGPKGGGRPSLRWAKGTHGSLPRDLAVSSMAQSVAKGASPVRI
ncbi:hypothetical protein CRG98_018881 [Punica granatum]|uniref:Uncharacterized protein n=1 Tax=Punica granatum TaxID=22663 RepID=A0A2I0JY16_PUNGR|nr:hypothetical protein CRG98_018881 [Punica granatum]